MKFDYSKASSITGKDVIVEFNTIDELLEFIKREGSSVIISEPIRKDFNWSITLYDDYME